MPSGRGRGPDYQARFAHKLHSRPSPSRAGDFTVVKERVGRNRYIAFRIDGGEGLQAGEVKAALAEAARHQPKEAHPWLVRFRKGAGIVRVPHLHKEAALQLLRSLQRVAARPVTVHTLGTTGTVRKAIRKYLEPLVP